MRRTRGLSARCRICVEVVGVVERRRRDARHLALPIALQHSRQRPLHVNINLDIGTPRTPPHALRIAKTSLSPPNPAIPPPPTQQFTKRSSSLATQTVLSSTPNHAPADNEALLLELVNAKTGEAVAKQELEELRGRFESLRRAVGGDSTPSANGKGGGNGGKEGLGAGAGGAMTAAGVVGVLWGKKEGAKEGSGKEGGKEGGTGSRYAACGDDHDDDDDECRCDGLGLERLEEER